MRRVVIACLVCVVLVCTLAAAGCGSGTKTWDGELQVYGALRAIHHEGQIGATVALDTLLPAPDFYAVGALAGLAGEITVIGGRIHLSYPDDVSTRTDSGLQTDATATLLVAAQVPAWQDFITEQSIDFADLDDEIANLAVTVGYVRDDRFPFLLEGEFEDLHWHVVDGSKLDSAGSSHEDHLATAARMKAARTPATLIGFYSQHDGGVFTHMGSATHMHCVLPEPLMAGHVDHVVVPAGTTVRFPVRSSQSSG